MDNCSEAGKADSGTANARAGPAIARALIYTRPGTHGRHSSHRDDQDGRDLRRSWIGLAGLAAVDLGSAHDVSRLRLTRMTAVAR